MPSRAHVNLQRVSIAFIVFPAASLLLSSSLFAADTDTNVVPAPLESTASLPNLGNSPDMDRFLSREVSDTFIFGETAENLAPNPPPSAPSNAGAAVLTSTVGTDRPLVIGGLPSEKPAANQQGFQSSEPWYPVFADSTDASDTVWERIIKSDRLPLAAHERVRFYEEQYQRESLWISKILRRGSPFLAHLVATLDQRFMPVELALLPAIESGYQPTAKSAGNAAGLWQIVPITAREIGVERDVWFDGRGDVLTSTTAAIDYLSYLNAEFNGDWELTLAAYNAGPGRVRAAMKKNADAQLPTDYWSLELPRETLNYVPKLIALVKLIKQPGQGGFDMPNVLMEPAFESIDVGFRVSLDKAAKIADIDEDLLRSLNAGLIHGVTAPEGPHYLLIPAGTGEQFQQAFANVDKSTVYSEPKTHQVAPGDTISGIALKYGLSQRALLSMNGLDDANIRIGQKLAVLDSRNLSASVIEYVVSIGDTLSEIAHKFSVNVRDITRSNGKSLDGDVIHPGDTLSIVVDTTTSG